MMTLRNVESDDQHYSVILGGSVELLESLESHLPNPEPWHCRDQGGLDRR